MFRLFGRKNEVAKVDVQIVREPQMELVAVVDESSSMEAVADSLPAAFDAMLNGIAQFAPDALVTLYGASGDPECDVAVQKRSNRTSLQGTFRYQTSHLRDGWTGLIRAGSPLRDGMIRGLAKAVIIKNHYLRRDEDKPVLFAALLDGDDSTSEASPEQVRAQLEVARQFRVVVKIVFFVGWSSIETIHQFAAECGLRTNEYEIFGYANRAEVARAVNDATEQMTCSARDTMQPGRRLR
jgi:hypothetical protein